MKKCSFVFASILLALPPLAAQVSNPSIIVVPSAPSGSCGGSGLPMRYVFSTGVLYACQNGTWGQIGGGGGGTVTSVGLTVPAWLTNSTPTITTSGVFAITPTAAQTSHQVIGTCGTATTFAPCTLTAGDIPSLSGTYLPLAGGTMTGALIAPSVAVTGAVTAPSLTGAGRQRFLGVLLFGDSTVYGSGATSPSLGWANLIGTAIGNATNYGTGGDQAGDTALKVYADVTPTPTSNNAVVLESMINDASLCQSTACQQNASATFLSAIAWAAIPNQSKILMGSQPPAMSTTGTWTTDSTLQTNLALQTVTNGSTLTFTTLVPSTSVYITWMAYSTGNAGSAALSCDSGVVTDTLNATGFGGQSIATLNGATAIPFTKRYTFAANTTHTCTVTATVSSGNPFSLVWAGTGSAASPTEFGQPNVFAPLVYVSGVIHEHNGVNDSSTAAYDTISKTTANEVYSDGWQVYWIDARSAVSATTDMNCTTTTLANGLVVPASTLCGVHPNGDGITGGHTNWAAAFLQSMLPAAPLSKIPGVLTPAQIGTGTPAAGKYVDGAAGAWTTLPPATGASVSKSSNYTVTANDRLIYTNSAITITLPSTGGPPAGTPVTVCNYSNTNTVTISGIVGANTVVSNNSCAQMMQLVSAGSWYPLTFGTAWPGVSSSIGGGALIAGACASTTVNIAYVPATAAFAVTPVTYPGDGFYWYGYLSAANTVTVKVCAAVAGTPTASVYNIRSFE